MSFLDVYKRQSYARTQEARALGSVIGEEELSEGDKAYLAFGKAFEAHFISQDASESLSLIHI